MKQIHTNEALQGDKVGPQVDRYESCCIQAL